MFDEAAIGLTRSNVYKLRFARDDVDMKCFELSDGIVFGGA